MAASTTDARINTGLPTHPKTVKLCRRLGDVAGWNLVQLILFAASQRPDGDLAGLTDEDLEISSGWRGQAGVFVTALVDLRWLDGAGEGRYRIHDWAIHNPYAASAFQRATKAKRGQLTRDFKDPEVVEKKLGEWVETQQRKAANGVAETSASYLVDHLQDKKPHLQDSGAATQDDLGSESRSSPAPAPSPTPSPSPSPLELTPPNGGVAAGAGKPRPAPCPHQAIIDAWHELMPELPRIRSWTSTRERHLQARWREDPNRQSVESWRDLLRWIRESDFLMGREHSNNRKPFNLTLAWLVNPENFAKVIEGNYHQ